jgi:hypothetical protein
MVHEIIVDEIIVEEIIVDESRMAKRSGADGPRNRSPLYIGSLRSRTGMPSCGLSGSRPNGCH